VNQVVPVTTDGGSGNYAQTDWSAVDLAKRAKDLGMAVFLCLFYDGYNTSDTPGLWKAKTIDQVAGVPPTPGLMYNYVKQEIELFRANGAMPDMVGIGNEVNTGMFTSGLLPAGHECYSELGRHTRRQFCQLRSYPESRHAGDC